MRQQMSEGHKVRHRTEQDTLVQRVRVSLVRLVDSFGCQEYIPLRLIVCLSPIDLVGGIVAIGELS